MKQSELREIVKQTILENQPQRSPERQSPDREVIEKPDTAPSKPTRRRTLTPPDHAPTPRPKAESVIKENEQEITNKITSRFQKLSKGNLNENTSRDKAIVLILGKTNDYSREELDQKTDQELAKILFGLIGK